MTLDLASCRSVVFDCDGVILQSNSLKSDAFGAVLQEHDAKLVAAFVDWHKRTGGVSRFEKFTVFFRDMLQVADWRARADRACDAFGERVFEGLQTCPYVPGFERLIQALRARDIPLAVNTGGAEVEIREVFRRRGLLDDFELVLGSPQTKHDNMKALRDAGLVTGATAYLGDSELDYDLAREFGMAFIYVAHESEWSDGAETTRNAGGTVVQDLGALIPL